MNIAIKFIAFSILFIPLHFLPSCKTGKENDRKISGFNRQKEEGISGLPSGTVTLLSPETGEYIVLGKEVRITWAVQPGITVIDSLTLSMDGKVMATLPASAKEWSLPTSGFGLGRHMIKTVFRDTTGASLTKSVMFMVISDLKPQLYTYRVKASYPHDPEAYTQGLIFDGGFLYESTGQYGHSSLRKVNPETGEPISTLSLDREYFGEGISLWKDQIIQLTWTSRVGFVYDKATFKLVNKIHYSTQGWGLTTDGSQLIMSDGSNILYFIDPELFTEIKRIEVFDPRGPVSNLNELEYIKGMIWANVYQTDTIVIIDPSSGKVTGQIDLKGILEEKYHHPNLDVLNGIAWDEATGRIFVTGKMWPRLFVIELVPVSG
jgi:glutamine cyclotransferase